MNYFKQPSTLCATLALTAALTLSLQAGAQTREFQGQGQLLDRVAAVVNDGVVLESEVDDQLATVKDRLHSQGQEMPPDAVIRQQIVEHLIVEEVEMQRADRAGLKISDETLNNAMTDVAQRNGITLQQLPQALAAQGIDYASYRDSMRRELTLRLLQQRDVVQRISVTAREIDQYLDRQSKHPSASAEYNVSHILIAVPQEATTAQLEAAQKKADDVYRRAKGGEDFAKLAIANSNSQTALDGGALGWRKGTELPTVLADTVLSLKAGEVSAPIRAATGFHIVRLNEVRNVDKKEVVEQVHARHILMRTNELQDDATVKQKLDNLRKRIIAGEDFAAVAQVSSQDSGSAADGGDLDWSTADAFPPEFAKQLDDLKVNEISEPFHTQAGWHIVQLLGRRKYDETQELQRKTAADQIRASKVDEETELWLRRLRDDAYVDLKS
ncbi:MAG TPA: peptidylprolyl isomerase [Steroidobacteraceae bacterium]|jgi:peptidyl-prolyl cis-trans isomerase SurA|nr:peptidylprolyl isomerase [Steroidobacteraceae bacterium]